MADAPRVYFHEDQHFRRSWLWLVIAIPIVAAAVARASAPRFDAAGIAVGIAVILVVALLLGLARLETEVRRDGVTVRFHGIWPTRRVPLEDIARYEARTYSILESGGWGVHFTFSGIAFNVNGNHAVVFTLRNGRRILVGTQRPDDFAAGVANALEARGRP